MREELDQLLCQRYPLIFAGRHKPTTETQMSFGFCCGDGWFDLIDTLCQQLQLSTDLNGSPQLVARQVKEKLGQLRFYVIRPTEEQSGMIIMAQALSAKICETCGLPGQLLFADSYGHYTSCERHRQSG